MSEAEEKLEANIAYFGTAYRADWVDDDPEPCEEFEWDEGELWFGQQGCKHCGWVQSKHKEEA